VAPKNDKGNLKKERNFESCLDRAFRLWLCVAIHLPMKTTLRALGLALGLGLWMTPGAMAIVGYVNVQFQPGDNLFHNPLQHADNQLSSVFSPSTTPQGTTISLWNASANAWAATSTYDPGLYASGWSVDLTLGPGTGARLSAPAAFMNTFVGEVRNRDGTSYQGDAALRPAINTGGSYLLGDILPIAASGTDMFLNVTGRLPQAGESVTLLQNSTQSYTTYTWDGAAWDAVPSLAVAQAGFFNLLNRSAIVPEPSAMAFAVIGITVLVCRRRI
jgi:hypothetical protein